MLFLFFFFNFLIKMLFLLCMVLHESHNPSEIERVLMYDSTNYIFYIESFIFCFYLRYKSNKIIK